jgi:hypothetical protein
MKDARDLFARCSFTEAQLNAIKQLYAKWFAPRVPEGYDGTATIAIWYPNGKWETSKGKDVNHRNFGFVDPEIGKDPLWEEHFGPLLPYMGKDAVITKLPPNSTMHPHIDRSWRAQAIYFPVEGCTPMCYSEYYDLPKDDSPNRQSQTQFPPAIYQYAIHDQAYLTNVHEWHGVRNTSDVARVAFGWNFNPTAKWSYERCRDKMIELGYVRE